mmetsp:Transcript_18378/g.30650  ORF Transcript_18378/g.30650 Transcript_18378/m.30650 type:complete len:648 (-) Transcript_18378:163-2106(-)|eukprot:CAMPEP_0114421370 /NCGR_PEP_ID=MMETSP0103-20121206/5041_1 /TAXON_ID=37642 ORGANISM="Paraphysomonas imperforata, Strain PA2" /NCGR_SAMPLE_ID=MMETSP0103 /ASSEMBLY_ACC=CAM_ASM_000201 /LENGTH=647 /DNA_ID=CAMNT_0001589885 /DNA_START=93 /DNA_END=2036 /DNA_ORIENTATION=-
MNEGYSNITSALKIQGLHVKEEWVDEQLLQQRSIRNDYDRGIVTEELFRLALFADFHLIGHGCLPPDVDQLHNVYLKGPFILQIDEMFNISGTSDKRYADGSGRVLKIFATDGCHNIVCLEQQRLSSLSVTAHHAGVKVCLINVYVRRGIFMLTNENTTTLGGSVAVLEQAKQSRAPSRQDDGTESLQIPGRPTSSVGASRQNGVSNQSVVSTNNGTVRLTNQPPRYQASGTVTSVRAQPQLSTRQQGQQQLKPSQTTCAVLPPPAPNVGVIAFPSKTDSSPHISTLQHTNTGPKLGLDVARSVGDHHYIAVDEDACQSSSTSGITSNKRSQSSKSEEEEMDDMEKMYSEEFEMMDEDYTSAASTAVENKPPFSPAPPNINVVQTNVIDMTEDDDFVYTNVNINEYHVDPPHSRCSPELGDLANLEARFKTTDVVNLLDVGPRDVAAPAITRNILAPKNSNLIDDFVPSPPRGPTLSEGNTKGNTTSRFNGGVATNDSQLAGKKRRIFFSDFLGKCDNENAAVERLCKEGFIEGKAISIKKFSVVEKKVASPYFLTNLEFSDSVGKRDVKISSELCENFLKMSAQEYIQQRNVHIQRNNLDKKKGSNDFKKKIAQNFGQFCGKFAVSYVGDEFVFQEFVGDDALNLL